jgi:hypothetical protein
MVMMDPQAVAVLPLWQFGLWLTGGAVTGAMIVEGTARRLIPGEVCGISVAFASLLGAPKLAMSSLLAPSGALVLLVIVALSNPFKGDLAICDQPFQRVLTEMAG